MRTRVTRWTGSLAGLLALVACRTDPLPPESNCEPLAFSSGDTVIELGFAVSEYRLLGEILRFGLTARSPECPARSGPPIEIGTTGAATWTGDCTTDDGVPFEGTLTETWDYTQFPRALTSVGDGWSVEARGADFDYLEFDGTWTTLEPDGGGVREDEVEADAMVLFGSKRGYLGARNFPRGLRGAYAWSGDYRGDPEIHRFEFAGDAICRGPLEAVVEVRDVVADGCPNTAPEEGFMELVVDGRVARIEFDDTDDCSGCFPWTLDGDEQPGRACAPGGF